MAKVERHHREHAVRALNAGPRMTGNQAEWILGLNVPVPHPVYTDVAQAIADAEERGAAKSPWESTETRPLVPGEQRLMALEILRNGEPDWDVFIATPCDSEDDEWSAESDDPGWAPSEVQFSMPVPPLPEPPTEAT